VISALESSTARLSRRLVAGAWVRAFGWHVATLLFVGGTAVLVARIAFEWERVEAARWLLFACIAPVSAWWVARRAGFDRNTAAAWLDVNSGASGLVVTERELGASSWSDAARSRLELANSAIPRVAWARSLRPVALALLFVAGALWLEPTRTPVGPPASVTTATVERVEEKLATLEETLQLEPEVATEMHDRLEQIQAQADDGTPESTFEALDRLEQTVDSQADQALDSAAHANDDLAQAASDPHLDDAQAAMEKALSSMKQAGLAKGLSEQLKSETFDPATLTLPSGVQLDSAQLAKLAQSLRGELDTRLAKLAKAGLLSAKELGKLGELVNLDDFDFDHVCDENCKKPGGT
jgi:hypothetical protein